MPVQEGTEEAEETKPSLSPHFLEGSILISSKNTSHE